TSSMRGARGPPPRTDDPQAGSDRTPRGVTARPQRAARRASREARLLQAPRRRGYALAECVAMRVLEVLADRDAPGGQDLVGLRRVVAERSGRRGRIRGRIGL